MYTHIYTLTVNICCVLIFYDVTYHLEKKKKCDFHLFKVKTLLFPFPAPLLKNIFEAFSQLW